MTEKQEVCCRAHLSYFSAYFSQRISTMDSQIPSSRLILIGLFPNSGLSVPIFGHGRRVRRTGELDCLFL